MERTRVRSALILTCLFSLTFIYVCFTTTSRTAYYQIFKQTIHERYLAVSEYTINNISIHTTEQQQQQQHQRGSNDQPLNWTCNPGIPCVYPEVVDFRIIVLTYDRPQSLQKLLDSLNNIKLDGDSARLEIWIDPLSDNESHPETLQTATNFRWSEGPTRVHVHKKKVGIYGQWIDTWSPSNKTFGSREIVLILEDDISVSPYAYRWLKAVHGHYGSRTDFLGATLTSEGVSSLDGRYAAVRGPKNDTVFMYRAFGSWGLSCTAYQWHRFQTWYHEVARPNASFHPYVEGLIATKWYKNYEATGRAHTMWTIWLLYYANQEKLFTVFNNLSQFNSDLKSCLGLCRREKGLHTPSKGREDYCSLLLTWDDRYTTFPNDTVKLDYSGERMKE